MQIMSKIYLPSTNSSSKSVCEILVFCSTSLGKYTEGTEVFAIIPTKKTYVSSINYYIIILKKSNLKNYKPSVLSFLIEMLFEAQVDNAGISGTSRRNYSLKQ